MAVCKSGTLSDIGTHRSNLVDHFSAFSATQREEIAQLWGCPGTSPEALARYVFDAPDKVREVVADQVASDEDARRLMEELAYDHDLPLDIGWSSLGARKTLTQAGLLAPVTREGRPGEGVMPAALAVTVAPFIRGVRTTIPTLLGALDHEYVERVAGAYEVVGTTDMEKILTLSEWLSQPDRSEDLAAIVPNPEYLGAALMALELGGVCYWQEVFGHDLHENPEFGSNVVALMRSDERDYERHMADTLMDYGLIFRVEEPDRAPLAVVPEELWSALWTIGRNWMMDWTASIIDDANDAAVRRSVDASDVDLQAALKWFACEADRGRVRMSGGYMDDETQSRLVSVGGHDTKFWAERLEVALELSALHVRRTGHAVENPTFRRVLDLPRSAFIRQVLFDWCTGYVGSAADGRLGRALGLDDTWRREVVKFLRQRGEFVPLWMEHEGVDQETTGSGYIRNTGDTEPDRLLMEIGLVNGLVWSAKLVWLDLLSFLPDDLWYPTTTVAELLQISTGLSTFGQLIHVLEEPNMGYYLPVQRASFLSDTFHTPEFESWIIEVVEHLLAPLGVARMSEDQSTIWLQTSHLRVESPPGLADDQREQLLREIFQDDQLEFRVPKASPNRLHRVDEPPEGDAIDLDLPLDVVRRWLNEREIVGFDGKRLKV